MRWKLLTGASFVTGLAMMLLWPVAIGARPGEDAPRRELAEWGVRSLLYFGLTCVAFLLAALFAWLWMRDTRIRYLRESKRNLDDLIESTLQDHAKRSE